MKTKLAFLFGLALSGCNAGSSANNTIKPVTPDTTETTLTDKYDREMISQIAKASKTLSDEKIWFDYGNWYKSAPIYMLRMDDVNNKDPLKVFLFNPVEPDKSFQKLGQNESSGLDTYRNDVNMHLANDKINKLNGMFDFDYKFEKGVYYAQKYHKLEMSPNNVDHGHKTIDRNISLNIHENFHKYQLKNFKIPSSFVQVLDGYPVNAELIELKLLTLQTFKGLPKSITKSEATSLLKKYVALTKKQIEIDTSEKRLVENMGLWQELTEGSAKYVETVAIRKMFAHAKDSTFVYSWFLENEYKTAKEVKEQFGFGIFYETGAAAIWLLNQAGYDLKKLESGVSPYQAATELLGDSFDYDLELLNLYATTPNASEIKYKAKELARL
ncbi:hypothetical protein LZI70_15850 [Vibrio pelagius]|uniref:Lipoprotein n=1 Tax=Vibrio pelagius TaxID=28169 RepID=A0ABY5GB49_VIBPE|nr:hypothetical protein [Vibrio pelagius]UTT86894.1 hypothetical protein LZI70_15850 [Vibrio pelagius]